MMGRKPGHLSSEGTLKPSSRCHPFLTAKSFARLKRMGTHHQAFFGNRVRKGVEHHNSMVRGANARRGARSSQRVRGVPRNQELPFVPPEDWHEPRQSRRGYRIVTQSAGDGYRHVLTPEEIRARLADLPQKFVEPLQVVQ